MAQSTDSRNSENLFTEFYNSAKDLILDKVSSPLIFSFVVAWLISNYKIIMVIFTGQSESFVFDYKIQLIESYLEPLHGFLYPFLGACFYTFLYPFIDQKIAKFTLERKMAIRGDKNEIEKAQLLTTEEVRAIHLRHFKIEQEYKVELEQARAAESQLRVQIESLQGEVNSKKLTQVIKKGVFDELSDDQIAIIDFIGKIADNDENPPTESRIRGYTKLNITKIKYALEELLAYSHIRKSQDDDSNEVYELTNKGLNVYIQLSNPT